MKLTIVISCALIAIVLSAPAPQQDVQIIELEDNNDGSGNYNYRFSLSDGTKRDETGELKQVQGEDGPVEAVVMTGSYEFTDIDGVSHKVTYTADENGFHPVVVS